MKMQMFSYLYLSFSIFHTLQGQLQKLECPCTIPKSLCVYRNVSGIEVNDIVYNLQNEFSSIKHIHINCNFKEKRNLTFKLLDDTYALIKTVKLPMSDSQTLIELDNNDLFYDESKDNALFVLPFWRFEIHDDTKKKSVLVRGSITRISEQISNIFESVKENKVANVTTECCNMNTNVYISTFTDTEGSGVVLGLYIFGNLTHTFNVSLLPAQQISTIHLTSNSLVVLLERSIYVGRYDRILQSLKFTKQWISNTKAVDVALNKKSYNMFMYNPLCDMCVRRQKELDLFVLFIYTDPPSVVWSEGLMDKWEKSVLDVQFQGVGNILSAVLDGERKNIVLLVEHNSSEEDVNSTSVVVFRITGQLYCFPFLFDRKTNLTLVYDNTTIIQVNNDNQERWISETGGCVFTQIFNVSLQNNNVVTPFRLVTLNLLASVKNRPCLHELINQLYNVAYQNNKYIEDDVDQCNIGYGLYIYTHLPLFLQLSLKSTGAERGETDITFNTSSTGWMRHLPNKTVVCPQLKISCEMTEIINGSSLIGFCRQPADLTPLSVVCPPNSWFVVQGFNHNAFGADSNWQQSCLDVVVGANSSVTFVNDYLPNIDLRHGSKMARDGFQGEVVMYHSRNDTIVYKLEWGTLHEGKSNLCFDVNFLQFLNIFAELEESCPIASLDVNVTNQIIYLDSSETFILKVTLRFNTDHTLPHYINNQIPLIYLFLSHVNQVDIRTRYSAPNDYEQSIVIFVKQKSMIPSVTSLVVTTRIKHSKCDPLRHVFKIVGTCPPYKRIYSSNTEVKDLPVKDLPVNYQPPSSLGNNLPQTTNVYNVDRSRGMNHGSQLKPLVDPIYKQCLVENQLPKSCHCNERKRNSSLERYSECIDHTPTLSFNDRYTPVIMLTSIDGALPLKYLYTLVEVNNRTDYLKEDYVELQDGYQAMNVTNNSSIQFTGQGLYHFRVELLNETTVSFCQLTYEFTVYIDREPLPKVIEHIVRTSAACMFGGIIFIVFILNFYRKGESYHEF